MDDCGNFSCSLAAGIDDILHDGRIHPCSPRNRRGRPLGADNTGPQSGLKEGNFNDSMP